MANGLIRLNELMRDHAGVSDVVPSGVGTEAAARQRDTPVPMTMATGLPFALAAGVEPTEIRPAALGVAGWHALLEVYGRVVQVHVRQPGEVSPVVVLTSARLPTRPTLRYRIRLDPGTVWVRAGALAGVSSYFTCKTDNGM